MDSAEGKKKNQDFSEKEGAILIEKVNENAEQLFARVSDQVTNKKKKIAMDGSKKKWDDVKRVRKTNDQFLFTNQRCPRRTR